MPSLREILDKQKAEKGLSNGQSVLQSKPIETKTSLPTQNKGNEAFSKETTGTAESIRTDATTQNSVVEQGPPEGLSILAKRKWIREHGTAQTQQSTTQAKPETDKVSEIKTEINKPNGLSGTSVTDTQKVLQENNKLEIEELRRQLTYLANNIEQKELVGQVVRTIMSQLKNNPSLTPYMADADIDLVVRGARRSYAIVARKKSEERAVRKDKNKGTDELNQMMRDAGLDTIFK